MGELKETIRNQAKDVEQLKEDLKHQTAKPVVSHGGCHGHGGGGEPSEEKLA